MFKHTATSLDTQPTRMQQRLMCDLKMPCCCLMVADTLMKRAIKSSSESTGNMKIKALM
jgi:hypothetical protein